MGLFEVRVGAKSIDGFLAVLGADRVDQARAAASSFGERLHGRVIWNISSTAAGGGVAEMLRSLLCYARGLGIDTRWVVIDGDPEFFAITKRLHHALHGSAGDGRPLDAAARHVYEEVLRRNALELASRIRRDDVVILHDPQTAGLAPALRSIGARLIWRCHVGYEVADAESEAGWRFIEPYLHEIARYVFSRQAYVPDRCDHGKSIVIQPSIDPFSPKNQHLDDDVVRSILSHTGLVDGSTGDGVPPTFVREDGSPGRVERRADLVTCGRLPAREDPLVVQVSRWDPLKDMIGVLRAFELGVGDRLDPAVQLMLAGPNVNAIADDPEAHRCFDEVLAAWRTLPQSLRSRVHLACLPMADVAENAAIVNALQRHATIVVQKSLREGFGLTVTEAMWKARPVVASAVGGIQDQIEDGVSGLLVKNPRDLSEFAEKLNSLLQSPERAREVGERGHERVREHFLGVRHLLEYARLIDELDAGTPT